MRLTSFTDFGLRALMRIASDPDRLHSTADLSEEFRISRNHLTKAITLLSNAGYVATQRGGGGGARLARSASEIRIGDVVAHLERNSALVECFQPDGGACSVTPVCQLKGILSSGHARFIDELNNHTLADCILPPSDETANDRTA